MTGLKKVLTVTLAAVLRVLLREVQGQSRATSYLAIIIAPGGNNGG